MIITKKIGDFNLIESGSLVVDQSNNISFFIENIEIEIVFNNTEEKKQEIKVVPIDDKKIQHQLFNFNNPLGTGPTKPMSVATLSTGEEIYFQYVVYAIGEIKILHYTWYSKPVSSKIAVQESDGKIENKE